MTQSNFSKNKVSDYDINIVTEEINRGVELILTGGKKKQAHPIDFRFEQIVCFLKRKVTIKFQFSLDFSKKR